MGSSSNWSIVLEEVSPPDEAGSCLLNLLDYLTSKCNRNRAINSNTGVGVCALLGSEICRV